MFTEKNTGTNLPAQIEIYSTPGSEYSFLFMAKGGGSANKSFLFQQTKAVLNEKSLYEFVTEKMKVCVSFAYYLWIVDSRNRRVPALPFGYCNWGHVC